jgi:hypothetical protein
MAPRSSLFINSALTYGIRVLNSGPGNGSAGKLGVLLCGTGSEEDLGLHLTLSRIHGHLTQQRHVH